MMGCSSLLRIESGHEVFIIWLSVWTGAIVQYFTNSLTILIIIISVICALSGLFICRNVGKLTGSPQDWSGFIPIFPCIKNSNRKSSPFL